MIEITLKTYSAIQLQNLLSLLPTLPNLPAQAQAELLEGWAKSPELRDAFERITAELDTITQAYQASKFPMFSPDERVQEIAVREAARIEEETGWDGMVP